MNVDRFFDTCVVCDVEDVETMWNDCGTGTTRMRRCRRTSDTVSMDTVQALIRTTRVQHIRRLEASFLWYPHISFIH